MAKKNLILGILILLSAIGNGFAAEEPLTDEQSIEMYLANYRQQIEDFYQGELLEITLKAEQEIALLEIGDEIGIVPLVQWAGLEIAQTVLELNDLDYKPYDYYTDPLKETPNRIKLAKDQLQRLVAAKKHLAQRQNDILTKLEFAELELERAKKYALTEGIEKIRQQLTAVGQTQQEQPEQGVVTGIIYSKRKPAAIINGKIVHQGDSIDQIKIAAIYPDRVEFDRKAKRWSQKVGEKAAKYW